MEDPRLGPANCNQFRKGSDVHYADDEPGNDGRRRLGHQRQPEPERNQSEFDGSARHQQGASQLRVTVRGSHCAAHHPDGGKRNGGKITATDSRPAAGPPQYDKSYGSRAFQQQRAPESSLRQDATAGERARQCQREDKPPLCLAGATCKQKPHHRDCECSHQRQQRWHRVAAVGGLPGDYGSGCEPGEDRDHHSPDGEQARGKLLGIVEQASQTRSQAAHAVPESQPGPINVAEAVKRGETLFDRVGKIAGIQMTLRAEPLAAGKHTGSAASLDGRDAGSHGQPVEQRAEAQRDDAERQPACGKPHAFSSCKAEPAYSQQRTKPHRGQKRIDEVGHG